MPVIQVSLQLPGIITTFAALNFLIAQPTLSNSKLPSLLGWDILRFFRIELDYVGQRVTLR